MKRSLLLAVLLLAAGQSAHASTISDAKLLPNNALASFVSGVVTYVAKDFYYIQEEAPEMGAIRVASPDHGIPTDVRVNLQGYVYTDANGERYLGSCG